MAYSSKCLVLISVIHCTIELQRQRSGLKAATSDKDAGRRQCRLSSREVQVDWADWLAGAAAERAATIRITILFDLKQIALQFIPEFLGLVTRDVIDRRLVQRHTAAVQVRRPIQR